MKYFWQNACHSGVILLSFNRNIWVHMALYLCSTGELHFGILRADNQASLWEGVYREAWKFEYDEKFTGGALKACSYKGCISGVGFGVYS